MTYNHGVETGAVELAIGTLKLLSRVEELLEVLLDTKTAVGVSGAIVETLESRGRGSGGRNGHHLC